MYVIYIIILTHSLLYTYSFTSYDNYLYIVYIDMCPCNHSIQIFKNFYLTKENLQIS